MGCNDVKGFRFYNDQAGAMGKFMAEVVKAGLTYSVTSDEDGWTVTLTMVIRDIMNAVREKTLAEINAGMRAIDDLKQVLPAELVRELYLDSLRAVLAQESLRKLDETNKGGR